MKKIILITLMLLLISNIFAEKTIISVFKDSKNTIDLKKISGRRIKRIKYRYYKRNSKRKYIYNKLYFKICL